MSLTHDPRPPLPDWITDAYAVLSARIVDSTAGGEVPAVDRDRAVAILRADEELALECADAEHALARLLERGYLYEVDTELRVTSPSE
ncbi:hypothetical protein [Natronococcus jeotgali]|uniref:Uncharacterized protein n=1 Tax=Natronococcus jeotgali DSM 18795 TaxID=1227498 RepID=L9XD37_9EURY|nr:hypothetical protein [Natronococcus jeotgali]ELY58518.1 hypothetical protein C492_11905 [Natronococcus jeotgali DSM 18795]